MRLTALAADQLFLVSIRFPSTICERLNKELRRARHYTNR